MAAEFEFATRDEASAAAAARIAELVRDDIDADGRANLVVSGGTTPAACFGELAGTELDWKRVTVFLSDERWVPSDHADSNEAMIRETLLQQRATDARLVPLFNFGLSADEQVAALQRDLPQGGFASALVGMGADGHFASLFPDADTLDEGLDPDGSHFYLPVRTAASPHPRISMTLAALQNSREIVLLFFGDEKRAVYEQAKAGDDSFPVSALLSQAKAPVSLYFAP